MPKRGAHHVLDGARLAVGKFDLDPLPGRNGFRTWTRRHGRSGRRLGSWLFGFWLQWFAIPLRIAEMEVRLNEIVDREVVLAVIEPSAATDDLLELDHGVDRTHQHDVADIASVHPSRELL